MTQPLPAVEIETGPNPSAAVVWLHGLGADGHDFEPVVDELEFARRVAVRFVFPHAPMRPVSINAGMVMRAWYDIAGEDFMNRADEEGVRASQIQVETLIARERSRGIPAGRIVVAGFSQGGVIALQTALRHPERLAGVLALSTYLALADRLAAEAHPANRETPIFLAHGRADPVLPLRWAETSRDLLLAAGYPVAWKTYPMPHAVCPDEIADIDGWLAGVLVPPA